MKRKYVTSEGKIIETDRADFFVGMEVEKTIAYGLKTLFVVGVQDTKDIYDIIGQHNPETIDHVYFGANQSFHNVLPKNYGAWDKMIKDLLITGYYSTLDFTYDQWPTILSMDCYRLQRFIPMVSIPPVNQLNWKLHNPATVLKFDTRMGLGDGVWCAKLEDIVMDKRNLTKWDEYKEDTIVSPKSKIVELNQTPPTSLYDELPSDVEPK